MRKYTQQSFFKGRSPNGLKNTWRNVQHPWP
jgi:hypothetical protein